MCVMRVQAIDRGGKMRFLCAQRLAPRPRTHRHTALAWLSLFAFFFFFSLSFLARVPLVVGVRSLSCDGDLGVCSAVYTNEWLFSSPSLDLAVCVCVGRLSRFIGASTTTTATQLHLGAFCSLRARFFLAWTRCSTSTTTRHGFGRRLDDWSGATTCFRQDDGFFSLYDDHEY